MEVFNAFSVSLQSVWLDSGFASFTLGNAIMIIVGLLLLYMAFVKEFEPLLLGPIAFGCILANFPRTGFFEEPGLMLAIHYGIANEIFPAVNFSRYRRDDRLRSFACASLDFVARRGGSNRRVRRSRRCNARRL